MVFLFSPFPSVFFLFPLQITFPFTSSSLQHFLKQIFITCIEFYFPDLFSPLHDRMIMFTRERDENNDLIDPRTHEERSRIWNNCLAYSRWRNGMIDWKLVKLGMFGCYDSSSSSSNHNKSNDNDLVLSSSFPRQSISLMETKITARFNGGVDTSIFVFTGSAIVASFHSIHIYH